jgi:hypothetical protein
MSRRVIAIVTLFVGAVCVFGCSQTGPVGPDAASVALATPAPGSTVTPPMAERAASRDVAQLFYLPSFAPVPGSSSLLVRNDSSITATMHTSGLTPGYVYTVAFFIYNNPSACTAPCSQDDLGNPVVQVARVSGPGHVAGNGEDDFGGHLNVGDMSGVFSGPGLLNPRGAEIHVTLRSHGPAIPELLDEQLHAFNGGCPPNTCANAQGVFHLP